MTGLTRPEAQALFLLSIAEPLSDLGLDRAINDALLKLSASLPTSQRENAQYLRERVHIDTTWWYYSREKLPHLAALQEAVCHDHTILLHYFDEQENTQRLIQRLLNPYGLVSKAGIWFLVAAQAGSGEQHILRVSRIQSVEISEESFVRPPKFDLATTWRDYCLSLEARHPQLARSARAIPGEALSQKRPVQRAARRVQQKNTRYDNYNKKNGILAAATTKKTNISAQKKPKTLRAFLFPSLVRGLFYGKSSTSVPIKRSACEQPVFSGIKRIVMYEEKYKRRLLRL